MKNSTISNLIAVLAAVLFSASSASGQLILEDQFDTYALGTLDGQGPPISGAVGTFINAQNASIVATGLGYYRSSP